MAKCGAWTHNQCGGIDDSSYDEMIGSTFAYTCPLCDYLESKDCSDTASDSASEADDSLDNSSHVGAERNKDKGKSTQTRSTSTTKRNLSFFTINFQSIKNKVAEFHALIEEHQPDIIAGTETWLNSDIGNSEIMPQGYISIRRDRRGDSHGGVMLAYKKDLTVTRRSELESIGENLWCQVNIKGRRPIIFGVIYKPKHNDSYVIDEVRGAIDIINSKQRTVDIIVTGDFNQGNVDWENNMIIQDHYASKVTAEKLLDFSRNYNMQQLVTEPTREDSILDLVFTNNTNIIKQTNVQPGFGDHHLVATELNLVMTRPKPPRRKVYLREKADVDKIKMEVKNYQKTFADLGDIPVQEKWDHLEKGFKKIMEDNVPSKMKSTRRNLPWYGRSNRRKSRKKQRLYNKAKCSGFSEDWRADKEYNKECRRTLNKQDGTILVMIWSKL